jgi:O-antigen/teichoic acid export membrane protein
MAFQRLHDLRRRVGVDRPVFFGLCGRGWSVVAGPISIYLIAQFLSPEEQGYYYTFSSVLALQWFLELGFSTCIVQFASHEFAHLTILPQGWLQGDARAKSRLVSVGRLAIKWYAVMAVLVVAVAGVSGQIFFSAKGASSVGWVWPWWLVCVTAGLNLVLLPLFSLLEGANQLSSLYGFQVVKGIVCSVALWGALAGRLGLYSPAFVSALGAGLGAVFLFAAWRGLLLELLRPPAGETVSWQREIWPFQRRLAITWISGYFVFNLFTPVLFYFHGPVPAGQMGMTWQVVNSLSMVAAAWPATKAPRFGMLISQRRYQELDHLFRISTIQAVGVSLVGGIILIAAIAWLRAAGFSLGARFLPVGCVAVLLVATVTNQVVFAQGIYLRAHKQEPFMLLTVVSACVCLVAIPLLGWAWGGWGVCLAYSATQVAALPAATRIWGTRRREWHKPST